MAHLFPLTVRGFHIDLYHHVNNARYLEFAEAARWELFQEIGAFQWMEERGIALVAVNINIDYKAAAYMNDQLTIRTVINPVVEGKRSGTTTQTVYRGDTLLAQINMVYCCINLKEERALRFEGELLQQLTKWSHLTD